MINNHELLKRVVEVIKECPTGGKQAQIFSTKIVGAVAQWHISELIYQFPEVTSYILT